MELTEEEIKVFTYLNRLRESGATNMFGASSYVRKEFGYNRKDSIAIVAKWMTNFDANGYEKKGKKNED